MKLFLFLDDYLFDSKRDVVRVFPAAKLEKILPHYSPASGTTHYNVATQRYNAWDTQKKNDITTYDASWPEPDLHLVESLDGENWTSRRRQQKGGSRLSTKGSTLRTVPILRTW